MAGSVVCNASPLIALQRVEHLRLLPELFGKVSVPPAVRREVFGQAAAPPWLIERPLSQPLSARVLSARLGAGESEAVALAVELSARELLLDDLPARRLAVSLELPVIGTLGLLLRAKSHGLIPQVRTIIDALIRADFRAADHVVAGILAAADEVE